MANPSVKKIQRDLDFRGLQPALAAGHGIGDFSTIAALATATMTIADAEVRVGMQVFAQIESSPDNDLSICKAIAQNGSVLITVANRDAVNAATAGNTKIVYFAR